MLFSLPAKNALIYYSYNITHFPAIKTTLISTYSNAPNTLSCNKKLLIFGGRFFTDTPAIKIQLIVSFILFTHFPFNKNNAIF